MFYNHIQDRHLVHRLFQIHDVIHLLKMLNVFVINLTVELNDFEIPVIFPVGMLTKKLE
jgi:hypothetical protein